YKVMAKKINLTDRKVFDAAYNAEMKVLEPKLEIKANAIQATLDEIARTDPRATKVSPQQLIDRRFLEEMEKDGTFDGSTSNRRILTRIRFFARRFIS